VIERRRAPSGNNYSYVLYDEPGGSACLVDPVAVQEIRDVLEEKNLDPVYLVNTHGHGDHTSGNSHFTPEVEVLCHEKATRRVGHPDRALQDGEILPVGSLDIEVLHTPGHTDGSLCLKTDSALVSGDTVFLAGCGNPKFGGNTRKIFESFKKKIRPLSGDLTLCPGHDYAEKNLRFAENVDPENDAVQQKLRDVRSGGEPRSTLEEERTYNPFFRFDEPELAANLDGLPPSPSDWEVFERLRDLRNQW
jgi:hydroxyacylglutathione hydrolase